MTSKLVVNTIEADTGISSVSFASSISMDSTSKFHFSAAGVDIGADTNINRPAAGVLGFNISGAEKLRIDTNGHLNTSGIATASNFKTGSSNLHSTGLTVGNNFLHTTGINVGTGATIHVPSSNVLTLGTNSSERLRITSGGDIQVDNGNVHIDDNGEFAIFEQDTALAMTNSSKISMDFASNVARIRSSHNGSGGNAVSRPLAFYIGSSEKLRIDSSGNALFTTNQVKLYNATDTSNTYFYSQNTGTGNAGIKLKNSQGEWTIIANDSLRFYDDDSSVERLSIDSSGSLLVANTSGSRTNLSGNADDIVIGNTSTSNETGISIFSTSASGIRFNDASGTDGAIEYGHSARELRFNAAGANRLQFGINASSSPVFSLGTGHYSGDGNNHNKGDRASVKVGAYLHLESALGAGHNSRAGLGYNCYFHSLEDFYCGTRSPSSGDNRPAAYGMAYGNHYFYSDASNTAHSAQASLTMTKNMIIHRQGYITTPNQPAYHAQLNVQNPSTGYLVFALAHVNRGSHYNTSNGVFTAPIAGLYYFFFQGIKYNNNGIVARVYPRKNNSNIYNDFHCRMQEEGSYANGNINFYVDMAANDTMRFYLGAASIHAAEYSHFGGMLVG